VRVLLGHVDAGKLQGIAIDRALHGEVMPGMSGDLSF